MTVSFAGATLRGGTGNDTITLATASATNALLLGDSGNDTITLGSSTSHLVSSTIQGGSQTDTTTDGADSISVGGSASAFIQGNAGNDVISVTSHVKSPPYAVVLVRQRHRRRHHFFRFHSGDLGNDTIDAASTQLLSPPFTATTVTPPQVAVVLTA